MQVKKEMNSRFAEPVTGHAVENQVVTLPSFGEVLLGVINDPMCAQGSNQFHIPRAAYTGHICAERLGDLYGKSAHASRSRR